MRYADCAMGTTAVIRSVLPTFWFVVVRHALVPEGHYKTSCNQLRELLHFEHTWSSDGLPSTSVSSAHKSNLSSSTKVLGGDSIVRLRTLVPLSSDKSYSSSSTETWQSNDPESCAVTWKAAQRRNATERRRCVCVDTCLLCIDILRLMWTVNEMALRATVTK